MVGQWPKRTGRAVRRGLACPCARGSHVHGVLEERMNSSGSVGKNQGEVKFEGWKVGEDGRGVDLLAKHQIHGSNPTKSH